MYCNKCGKEIPENVKFCPNCGNKIKGKTEDLLEVKEKEEEKEDEKEIEEVKEKEEQKDDEKEKEISKPGLNNSKKKTIGIFIVLLMIIVGLAGYVGFDLFSNKNNPKNEKVNTVSKKSIDKKDKKEGEDKDNQDENNADQYKEDEENTLKETPENEDSNATSSIIEGETAITEDNPNKFTCGYVFPESDSRYLNEEDLMYETSQKLALGRNEIYARHGYVFKTEPYKTYFEHKDWYAQDPSFKGGDSSLNEFEKYNIKLFLKYEND
ncbi:YARHG domain-containing protein [Haloimpatiens sp. FM7315]|uniref:YARHG domain-containing protein n=1 Tax=Haloimpatiens sp. FM7315 TaxID=3298609 RepID=UPI0035A29049